MKKLNSTLKMNSYQENWETRSSIRTRPRKCIDFKLSGYFFPETKQPLLLNDHIIKLGEEIKKEILTDSFRKYLHDIINLEIHLIVKACMHVIYNDKLPINFSSEIKLNAYSVIIDEYYHVYIAQDMLSQLDQYFPRHQNIDYPISDSYQSVIHIQKKLPEKFHEVFDIVAVCVFETTLVRELIEFFNTPNIHPSIRYYINDHMNDEAKHYNYFFELLKYTWNRLPEEYQQVIGENLGEFIIKYLNIESDKSYNKALAQYYIKTENLAEKIVQDLYKGFTISQDIPIVRNVLNVLNRAGIIDVPSVQTSLKKYGLAV
jgi:hypothetical protein